MIVSSSRSEKQVEQSYQLALEKSASIGVDVESAILSAAATPITLHCWQGDDVRGGFDVKPEDLDPVLSRR